MNQEEHLFYEKIQCIYNNLTQKDINEFTNLFFIPTHKTSWENRKSYLYKKWVKSKEQRIKSRLFRKEYESYPFSQLRINGRKLFENVQEFYEVDIKTFCERIKSYVDSLITLESRKNTQYQYLYVYNRLKNKSSIDYYHINYGKPLQTNSVEIEVDPPQSKALLSLAPYYGTIQWYDNNIVLIFQNQNDYISAIFNTDLINTQTTYLVGVGVGIADINQKTPIAKKVVLTKEKIDNIDELYLALNETEVISAEENSYKFEKDNQDFRLNHLQKYIKKIDNINTLFQNLSKENPYNQNTFYEQLAFKEFLATNTLFQKLAKGQSYFVNNRERVLDVLIASHAYEPYQELYIVMPIYTNDNLFEKLSFKALKLQEQLIELSSKVNIEIIFVMDDCQKALSLEFKTFLEKAHKSIKLYFVVKEDIENEVNSIDFIFTDRKNFALSRILRTSSPVFHLFRQEISIDQHKEMYQKILNRSLSYQAFSTEKICTHKPNDILEKLIGRWYLHLYGTQKFWIDKVDIKRDNSIVLTTENGGVEEGEIIYKSNQSIMLLEDIKTKQLLSMVFENHDYLLNRAFLIKVMGKKFNSNLDLFTVGIMSRHKIPLEQAQHILGDVDDVRLIEPESIQDRLSDYLTEKFYT